MKTIKKKYAIIIIILAGLALRVWGLNFGLPYPLHQDEPIVINHALAFGSGDFNPHFFVIPPFASYLLFIFYGLFFILGKILGIFAGREDFAIKFFLSPTAFYLIARAVLGVIPSGVAVWLTYILYKKIFGDKGALYAACIVAASFLCVTNGHYAYVDNMMVVFVLLTYIRLFRAIEEPSLGNYCLSGIFMGLAIATKYNAALLLVSFCLTHSAINFGHKPARGRIVFNKFFWLGIAVCVLAFILANPFSVIDWRFFLESVTGRIRKGYVGWMHHLSYSLGQGLGSELLTIGLTGIILSLIVEKKFRKWLVFVSFPAAFYLHLAFLSQPFSRYALVLIPFIACWAAFFIYQVLFSFAGNKTHRVILVIFSAVLLLPTLIKAIKADLLFSAADTRVVSARWIEENIPAGAKIAVDSTSFRPLIMQTKEQVADKYRIATAQEGLGEVKKKKISLLLKSMSDKKTYEVYFLTHKTEEEKQFLSMSPNLPYDLGVLADKGVAYVTINYNGMNKQKSEFVNNLKTKAGIVAEFSPYYDSEIRLPFDRIDKTFMPVASEELFCRNLTGPAFVIYKIKAGEQ